MSQFGSNLNSILAKAKMTQAALADKTGLTPAAISQIIAGKREPQLDTLILVCRSLHVTPNDLLGFTKSKDLKMFGGDLRVRLMVSGIQVAIDDLKEVLYGIA